MGPTREGRPHSSARQRVRLVARSASGMTGQNVLVVWRLSACRHGKVGLEDDCFIGGVNAPTCLMCGRTRGPDEMRVGSPAQTRNSGFTGSSHCGVWGWWSKRPGCRGQCRGTTTEHRSLPWAPHQPKLACNSGTRTFCSARKRCNSNGVISTFEIRVGELHATFLRNHNMRRHKDPGRRQPKPSRRKTPKQKTPQARKTTQAEDNASPEDPRNPRQPPQPPQARGRCTRYGALHPLCGGAPVMWRCTRTEEVHCLRIGRSAPTYKNKRGTGPPNHSPPHPSMRSWALLVAGRPRRPRHHLHPGPLLHLPHPYMRRAGLRAI